MSKVYTMDEVIKMGTEIGVQTGIEYIRKEKEQRRKSRYDRRLRNTKLLLREYRKLAIHSKDAICTMKLNPVDVLDELDEHEYADDLYIESIKASKERTVVIIEHIIKMMKIYKYLCYKSKRPEEKRRYEIIYELYIKPNESTADELSAKYNVDVSTIYRDVNKAVEALSALLFGIDGLKIN